MWVLCLIYFIGYLILTSFSIINHSFLLMNTSNRKCETDYPVTSWLPCPALLNIPDCTSNTLNGQLGRLPLACFPDIGPFANIMPVSNVMKMPSYHRQNVSSFIFINWYIYIVRDTSLFKRDSNSVVHKILFSSHHWTI